MPNKMGRSDADGDEDVNGKGAKNKQIKIIRCAIISWTASINVVNISLKEIKRKFIST